MYLYISRVIRSCVTVCNSCLSSSVITGQNNTSANRKPKVLVRLEIAIHLPRLVNACKSNVTTTLYICVKKIQKMKKNNNKSKQYLAIIRLSTFILQVAKWSTPCAISKQAKLERPLSICIKNELS